MLSTLTLTHLSLSKSEMYEKEISNFVQLSTLPGIVKSVSYFEPRFIEYEDYSTTFFTDIQEINYMKYTYE